VKLATSLRISGRQLAAHRTRTALALVGIVIGVSAVIVVVAVGQGAQDEVLGRIDAMGTNLIVVSAGQMRATAGRQPARGSVTTMTVGDAAALVEECPSVAAAAPVESQQVPVRFGALSANTAILATTPVYADVRRIRAARGAFFTEEEETAALRVALVGPTVVTNLFGGRDPVGETIRLNTVPFEVGGSVVGHVSTYPLESGIRPMRRSTCGRRTPRSPPCGGRTIRRSHFLARPRRARCSPR